MWIKQIKTYVTKHRIWNYIILEEHQVCGLTESIFVNYPLDPSIKQKQVMVAAGSAR